MAHLVGHWEWNLLADRLPFECLQILIISCSDLIFGYKSGQIGPLDIHCFCRIAFVP
jgi:hypothetical protein